MAQLGSSWGVSANARTSLLNWVSCSTMGLRAPQLLETSASCRTHRTWLEPPVRVRTEVLEKASDLTVKQVNPQLVQDFSDVGDHGSEHRRAPGHSVRLNRTTEHTRVWLNWNIWEEMLKSTCFLLDTGPTKNVLHMYLVPTQTRTSRLYTR